MANNIFTNQLNNRELMDAFGIQQDNAPLTPEQLVALSEQQQAPAVEEIAEPVQAPIKTAIQPTLKKAQIEQSMEPSDSGISKAMDALKNWENRPKEETSSINQTQTQATTIEAPMSKSEALIAEYNKLLGKGQEDLAEARRRDRMLKVGGSLGDALATYLNARSQMNVKAPGVQVQQGAGLGKIADMFATAPEIASDIAQRREAMMKQYAELAKGERSQARLTSEEKRAEKRMQQQERMAKAENETMLKAAGIRASRKEEKEKGLTPYQEMMKEEKAKTRQEKDANILEELENRRTIVEQNVERAKNLIDKYGTVELFGSEAEQLNGIMQEIATDVAKLQDPKSVARPSEVESIRKTLIPESTSERMMLSNETAMDILDKFKERINERADIGYSVRGFDPKTKKPITQQSKTDTLIKIKAPSGAIREVSQQNAEEYLKRPGYSKVD